MPKPTDEAIETAIAWLECNEGDGAEREACQSVASWLADALNARSLRAAARAGGVPVRLLRQRLAAR